MHRLVWVCVACLPRRRNGSAGTGEVSPGGGEAKNRRRTEGIHQFGDREGAKGTGRWWNDQ